jgi:hypothetical protein
MTLWSSVADCWKDGDKMQFDAGVLESVFPADHDQKQKRGDIFKAMDGNGNGYVSLAEFDDWFNRATCARERLHGLKPVEGKSTLFPYARPSLIRAFSLAKGAAPPIASEQRQSDFNEDDYVTNTEVALLMMGLQYCLKIFRVFDAVDRSHDRRLDRREWDLKLGHINHQLSLLGYKGHVISSTDFNKVDKDEGGMILLSEAVYYFLKLLCPNETLLKRNEVLGANPTMIDVGKSDALIPAAAKKNPSSKSCAIL